MHNQCRQGRWRGGDEMLWISWDESFQIKFVFVCIISVSKVPEERKRCSVSVFEPVPSPHVCVSNTAICYTVYISHACLISPYETWFLMAFTRTIMFNLFVSCLSLLLLNFLFNNLITKESWWKTLFKVYMICPYHVFQHILLYYLYVFMYMLDNAKYVLDFLSHLYIIYII